MTDRRRRHCYLSICYRVLYAALAILQGVTYAQADSIQYPSDKLELDFLRGVEAMESPRPTHEFAPAAIHQAPSNHFEGLLRLFSTKNPGRLKVLKDSFGVAVNKDMRLAELPPFSITFVMDGENIIPLKRTPQRSDHPYWELIPEPGIAWDEPGDDGWSHASLPFSLKEKNQNCVHNGLMTFLYKDNGSMTRVAWQITSETCLYLKVDLWGLVKAVFEPRTVASSDEVIASYRKEVTHRLPVKPFSALEQNFPGLSQAAFVPAGKDDVSVYGFVMDGVHYRSECPTRYGPYPFCEVLDLPSYSLSKSLFGGLGYMILSKRWPEFASTPISGLIPQCDLPDKRWQDVTAPLLLNMTTGNYDSGLLDDDEDNRTDAFFIAETHKDKIRFSCEAWSRKATPGTKRVYHTTDTYLLGVAMNNHLKDKLGEQSDVYRDLVYTQVFKPLGLSPVLRWTQRTYDKASQPFTGYGLIFHNDDLARISATLNSDNDISRHLAGNTFNQAMFRAARAPSMSIDERGLAYSNGIWGIDVSRWISCSTETWVPFLSGYGGISVAMFPNGSVYYYFTDSDQHGFRNAAIEANKALNYCKEL